MKFFCTFYLTTLCLSRVVQEKDESIGNATPFLSHKVIYGNKKKQERLRALIEVQQERNLQSFRRSKRNRKPSSGPANFVILIRQLQNDLKYLEVKKNLSNRKNSALSKKINKIEDKLASQEDLFLELLKKSRHYRRTESKVKKHLLKEKESRKRKRRSTDDDDEDENKKRNDYLENRVNELEKILHKLLEKESQKTDEENGNKQDDIMNMTNETFAEMDQNRSDTYEAGYDDSDSSYSDSANHYSSSYDAPIAATGLDDQIQSFLLNSSMHISEKLEENEGTIMQIDINLNETIKKVDEINTSYKNIAVIMDQFRKSLSEVSYDVEVLKINTTANMDSFDRTTDLSLTLFNEMNDFNADISDRLEAIEAAYSAEEGVSYDDMYMAESRYLGEYYDDSANQIGDIEQPEIEQPTIDQS